MDLKDISNQVKFYVKKYGVFKTIKKCFVVVKNKEYIKHDYPYGSYIDWFNEFGTGIVGSQNPHIAEELIKAGYNSIHSSFVNFI